MPEQLVLSPSEFVDVFNQTVDYAYPRVVIEGEVSSFRVAKGRWVYFDIKDETSTIKCFGTVYMLPGPIEDGMMVQIVCTPRLHPLYNFSLQLQSIVPKGEGAIARAAELTYQKLAKEGLFSLERKRPLPYAPERIALITSIESAAYADFIKITRARWPALEIDVFQTLVQGIEAPGQIVDALTKVNASAKDYEVVVVIRGGGSAEDLSSFNDERLVRALAASRIPSLVAIGHEIDESLAELTADSRASTPSNAAELLTPDIREEVLQLQANQKRLHAYISGATVASKKEAWQVYERIKHQVESLLTRERLWLELGASRLELLDPRLVLERGYAMLSSKTGVVSSIQDLHPGMEIAILMKDGEAKAKVL